ncbi:sodium-dependent transporter [bacterium]|nr:sodium-dependent transporter [bacterium]
MRGSFSNRIGFIAAAAGSAIGLGNIWKFPYEAGSNGGAAFLVIYVICAFVLCFPIMVSEIAIGRRTQLNPYGAFVMLSGSKSWGFVGVMGVLCGFMILSFYNVVAGWAFGYFLHMIGGDFDVAKDFIGYTTDFWDNLFFSMTFMFVTALIVAGGVQKGIEKWSKIMMPALVLILLFLIGYAFTLDNAMKGVEFYLVPNFSLVTGKTVYTALSQAFFSLSLGMGALITYGSYMNKSENVVSSAAIVTLSDTTVAFLAGLMIFPFVYFQGLQPSAGPGLVFVTLPGVFEHMGAFWGRFVGASFFLLLCFAALTSTISLLEVPVAYMVDEKKWPRKRAVWILATIIFIIGLPSMFSTGAVKWCTEFISYGGSTHDFLSVVSDIFNDTFLPLGGFLISTFAAYKWKTENLSEELAQGNPNYKGSIVEKFLNMMVMFVCPLIIGIVFVITILQKFIGIQIF